MICSIYQKTISFHHFILGKQVPEHYITLSISRLGGNLIVLLLLSFNAICLQSLSAYPDHYSRIVNLN